MNNEINILDEFVEEIKPKVTWLEWGVFIIGIPTLGYIVGYIIVNTYFNYFK